MPGDRSRFASHVGSDTSQEVKDDELVRSAVVQPFIHRSSLPDRVEVHTDGVGGRDNGTGDDVVTVQERSGNRLANTVDVDLLEMIGEEGDGRNEMK